MGFPVKEDHSGCGGGGGGGVWDGPEAAVQEVGRPDGKLLQTPGRDGVGMNLVECFHHRPLSI